MSNFSPRKNARRFFRVDMPVHILVTPSSPIPRAEIYALGINYFPPIIKKLVEKQLSNTNDWSNKIQEQKEILTPLFEEIIESIELLGKGVKQLSDGINPKNNLAFWKSAEQKINGFTNLKELQKMAPKTYTYFKFIEEKYLYYLECFFENVENSTTEKFNYNVNLIPEKKFKIDEITANFSEAKFEHIPLVQSILALTAFLDTYFNVFRQLNNDHSIKKTPSQWPLITTNLSASGASLPLNKHFKANSRLNVFIFFPENKKILKFDGTIANITTIESTYQEKTAINFDFPDGNNQEFLIFKIQEYELKLCENLAF